MTVSETAPKPQTIYRLATPDEWDRARADGVVPRRAVDERDGFVHCATEETLIETANKHFRDEPELLALEIAASSIGDALRMEWVKSRGAAFPHVHRALVVEDVLAIRRLRNAGNEFQPWEQ